MDFTALGLNAYETKTYAAVVSHGKAPASTISRTSGVPYGRIYDTLAALEAKGLVKVLPGAMKQYTPGDPAELIAIVEKRKEELRETEEELKRLKQVYEEHTKDVVQIAQGKANFYRMMQQMPTCKKFDYAIKYTSAFESRWAHKHKEHKENGIVTKVLARVDESTAEDLTQWLALRDDMRSFENHGVAMSILDGGVLIALIKSNTTIVIQDESFIDLMKRLFEAAYEHAPPINADSFKKQRGARTRNG